MPLYRCVRLILCLNAFATVIALFEQCNHVLNLKSEHKIFINSPYYPQPYPIGTSCRYTVLAPRDHQLIFKCDIQLNVPSVAAVATAAARCYDEIVYFNREGSELLSGSEYFCGSGTMERRSFLNRAVISYISALPPYRRNVPGVFAATGTTAAATATLTSTAQPPITALSGEITRNSTTTTKLSAGNKYHVQQQQSNDKRNGTHNGGNSSSSSSSTTVPSTIAISTSISGVSLLPTPSSTTGSFGDALAYVTALLSNSISTRVFIAPKRTRPTNIIRRKTTTRTTRQPAREATAAATSHSVADLLVEGSILPALTWRKANATTTPATTVMQTKATLLKAERDIDSDGDHVINSPPPVAAQRASLGASRSFHTRANGTRKFGGRLPRIVVDTPPAVGGSGGGGGTFSCFVEAVEAQCDCGWGALPEAVNPSGVASLHEFASMAGVLTVKYGRIFCGAAIIHHRFLLSAAHCFVTAATNSSELIRVVVGEHDLSTMIESLYTRYYDIDTIIVHEQYRTTTAQVRNDIALLRTRHSIEWNRGVAPACLPFRSVTGTDGGRKPPIAGQQVLAAGWGTITFGGPQSTLLLRTPLDVITNDECRQSLSTVPSATFCTYTPGRDTCQYDSGGALYLRTDGRLFAVGIVSYGYACAAQQPSVNTKVASFIRWIKSKTPEVKYCIK